MLFLEIQNVTLCSVFPNPVTNISPTKISTYTVANQFVFTSHKCFDIEHVLFEKISHIMYQISYGGHVLV